MESPKNLKVNIASAANTLDIEWDITTIGESYEIYKRKTGETYFSKIADNIGLYNNSYVDNNLEGGKVYSYKVRSKNSANAYSSWSNTMSMHASHRELNDELMVTSIMFTDKGKYEPWWRGDPELLLVVVGYTSSNNAYKIYDSGLIQTSDVSNNNWFGANLQVNAHWNPNYNGSVLTFVWSEMDGGSTVTYTVTGSYEDKNTEDATTKKIEGSITYTSKEGNENIVTTLINWWDDSSTTYKAPYMHWKLN